MLDQWEKQLDSFDAPVRKQAVNQIAAGLADGTIDVAPAGDFVNMHAHTFYSFNCYGYSPSKFAWLAKKSGLAAAGIVDFDVLDGADEFLEAAGLLNLRACASIETRVFVPEFASLEINSPGEPGVAYHMGCGIPTGNVPAKAKPFLDKLKQTAQQRNRSVMERVNAFLAPVEIDFSSDVLPLTPAANPTERHICLAFARKAAAYFVDWAALSNFWQNKLGESFREADLPESPKLLNAIRSRTMKQGGPGYVAPDAGAFATMRQMNEFVLDAGGIPALAWLNGLTPGERQMERLLDVATGSGVAAFNIIPDRNFTPGVQDEKLAELQKVVRLCQQRHLPVLVGTEMNSFGQKFIDAFETQELAPMLPVFLSGARILYAHTVLQHKAGMGYVSDWARGRFADVRDKNKFFEAVGRMLEPQDIGHLKLSGSESPNDLLKSLSK